MKLSLVNTADLEGGAALATYRLHRALLEAGMDSVLHVQSKSSADPTVQGPGTRTARAVALARPTLDQLALRRYPGRPPTPFSTAWLPDRLAREVAARGADLVHLFWVTGGFMRIETLRRFGLPVVWTLHDMWPMTGGCHYDGGCARYETTCGHCPQLGSRSSDASSRTLDRKRRALDGLRLTVVATSQWMADCARRSTLFRDHHIVVAPNCVDMRVFKPAPKTMAREMLNLPQDRKLVLVSAFNVLSDPRKGFAYLQAALATLAGQAEGERLELVVIGARKEDGTVDLGLPTHYAGRLADDLSQVLLYSACDVLVSPSVQENLSNTVVEALACGTPVVAFDTGGQPDMVDHLSNGYLARPFEAQDLAEGIRWCTNADPGAMGERARSSALARFSPAVVVPAYRRIYEECLS